MVNVSKEMKVHFVLESSVGGPTLLACKLMSEEASDLIDRDTTKDETKVTCTWCLKRLARWAKEDLERSKHVG